MTPEREKYLRSKLHTGSETHTMEFKACEACELGEAFAEIDKLRGDAEWHDGIVEDNIDLMKERDQLRDEFETAAHKVNELQLKLDLAERYFIMLVKDALSKVKEETP